MNHKKPNTGLTAKGTRAARRYILRLYVCGASVLSRRAIVNIKDICDKHLNGRFDLQVIDIYQTPSLAKDEQIIAAPTLIKQLPLPLRRLVGDLSDHEHVLFGLDLKRKA